MIPEFTKYNSLTLIRLSREEELQHYKDLMQGKRCVVTEKIHGANFEVITDGVHVKFARRTGYIEEGESFYGYQYVAEVLGPRVIEMFKDYKEIIMEQHHVCDDLEFNGQPCNRPDIPRDFQTLSIRGELAGGHYPAESVPEVKVGRGQVGKGKIWYSQDKSFYAFELCIDDKPLDFYAMGSMCSSYGIPLAPVLFFGSFEECLEYSQEHLEDLTVVPRLQPLLDANGKPIMTGDNLTHLPIIEGNTREGHVIATVYPDYLPNGKRTLFKHKGQKYMEDKGSKQPKRKVEVVMSDGQTLVFNAILPLICVNRMVSVMSKVSLSEPKDFAKVVGLVVQDAIEEATEDKGVDHIFFVLTTKERKQVTGQLMREAAGRLRSAYFN